MTKQPGPELQAFHKHIFTEDGGHCTICGYSATLIEAEELLKKHIGESLKQDSSENWFDSEVNQDMSIDMAVLACLCFLRGNKLNLTQEMVEGGLERSSWLLCRRRQQRELGVLSQREASAIDTAFQHFELLKDIDRSAFIQPPPQAQSDGTPIDQAQTGPLPG